MEELFIPVITNYNITSIKCCCCFTKAISHLSLGKIVMKSFFSNPNIVLLFGREQMAGEQCSAA